MFLSNERSVVRLCCTYVHVGRCSCLLNESWPFFQGTSGWFGILSVVRLCCTDVHVGRCSCLLNESWPFEGTSGWSVTLSVVRLCCTDVHVGRCSCLLDESWPFEGTSDWSVTLSFQLHLQRLEYISITYPFVRVVKTPCPTQIRWIPWSILMILRMVLVYD